MQRLRKARGMTAEKLEEAAGLAPGQVSRIESGSTRDPRPSTIAKLARALEVTTEELLRSKASASAERVVETPDVYPSRAQAIALLRGKVNQETLDALRFEQLKSSDDPGLHHWISRARELQMARDNFDEVDGLRPTNVETTAKRRQR